MPSLIPRASITTKPNASPRVQNTARLDTSHIQQGIGQLGAVASAAIEREIEIADHARLSEARTELANLGVGLNDPENPEGVLSFRGENALSANERLLPKVDAEIGRIRQRLTPRQQAQFDGIAQGWRANFADGLNRHMARETEK